MIGLLRLPSFHADFFPVEESNYLLLAEQLASGKALYSDVWHAGPPIMVWVYTSLEVVFGDYSRFFLHLFACIYIYLSAVYLNGMLSTYKPVQRFIHIASILFVVLTSVPWYAQEFSPSLFILLPSTIAFHLVAQLSDSRTRNYQRMFVVGMLIMLCILTSYKSVFILLGILLAYVRLYPPRLDEFIALIGGLATTLLSIILIFFFSDSLGDFWEIGILYYFDRINLANTPVYPYELVETLYAWILSWGGILILAIWGFFHFRLRFYTYIAQVRSIETTMAGWLIGILIMLLAKVTRLELSDFILMVPPLVFYSTKAFELAWGGRPRWLILAIIVAAPMFIYMNYWGMVFPDRLTGFNPSASNRLLHGGMNKVFSKQGAIYQELQNKPTKNGIWILSYEPQTYLSLGQTCQNKYQDFRIAYFKFSSLPGSKDYELLSPLEEEKNIFLQFEKKPPQYILDPKDNFSNLQTRYPGIFSRYKHKSLDEYQLYYLK